MLRKFSLRHYLLISFAVAAFALLGEALCALSHGGRPLRGSEGTTTNALLIAPARTPAPRRVPLR